MRILVAVAGALVGITAITDTPSDEAVAPVTRAEFEKLRKELVPASKAAWETIPWRSDLLAAREEAVKSGKPLFLWAMNGHPLGCT